MASSDEPVAAVTDTQRQALDPGLLVEAGFAAAAASVLAALCFYCCCLRVAPAHKEAATRGHKRLGKVCSKPSPSPSRGRAASTPPRRDSDSMPLALDPTSRGPQAADEDETSALEMAVTEMTSSVARL